MEKPYAPLEHSLIYHTAAHPLYLSAATYAPASGELYELLQQHPNGKITVAGSSLGGHLAIAFAALFPSLTSEAYAFNAPGFAAKPGVERLFELLGAARPAGPAVFAPRPGSNIINVVSSESLVDTERTDLIAGMGGYPGHGVLIPIENQYKTDVPDPKNFSWNHDQRQITDSLAVHALLNKLDPTLDLSAFNRILRTAASGENRSLENIVDALESALGLNRSPMPAGNRNRDALYNGIDAVQTSAAYAALAGRVFIKGPESGREQSGQSDLSSLVSLENLTPLRLTAAKGHEGVLDAVLAYENPALHLRWVHDQALTPAQRADGEQAYSDHWMVDRSSMLEAITVRNLGNLEGAITSRHLPSLTTRARYQDMRSGEIVVTGDQSAPGTDVRFGSDGPDALVAEPTRASLYGGDGADTLRGDLAGDWLEGNDGNDLLDGGAGADALLGGAGADTLRGGPGNDSLVGGPGDDELHGGPGSDQLRGGPGFDRYLFDNALGHDTIDDTGLSGLINIAPIGTITGSDALKIAPDVWRSPDGSVRYTLAPASSASSRLTLSFGQSSITIRDWRNGGLGITLGDLAPVPVALHPYDGDFVKQVGGSNYVFHDDNYASVGLAPGAMDLISSANVASHIRGAGGNDGLAGHAAADLIDGGDGDDLLFGHLGADTLIGGSGNDLIHGSGTGNLAYPLSPATPPWIAHGPELARGFGWVAFGTGVDANGVDVHRLLGADATWLAGDAGNLIDGGSGNDRIHAGSGDDTVDGGADDDDITGLGGADMLFGDDGNDTIAGDGIDLAGYVETVSASLHGADFIDGGGGNDSLIGQGGSDRIYGGTGDDRLWGDESDARLTPWQFHGDDELDGGDGADELIGGGGSDTLLGGEGHDSLFGDASPSKVAGSHHGDDHLDAGSADDYLEGGGRDDTLLGGAGSDMLWGDTATEALVAGQGGRDELYGGDGNDTLIGGELDDTLLGGTGNDQLIGDGPVANQHEHGDDLLYGGAGSDSLYGDGGSDVLYGGDDDDLLIGGDGDDVLIGGDGTDLMRGGAGNDVYLIGANPLNSRGEAESIIDHQGSNRIVFERIASQAVQVAVLSNGDLQFSTASGDALLVDRGAADTSTRYDFADGASFDTRSLIRELSLTPATFLDGDGREQAIGGRSADVLTTSAARATLAGGRGDDRLQASGGGNLYLYRLGDGSDTIVDTSVARGLIGPEHVNRISFGPSIVAGDLRLMNSGGSSGFQIRIGPDAADSIRLGEFDASSQSPSIDAFRFEDGSELSFAQLAALGFEGDIGDDTMIGTRFDDRLDGSFGNDLLVGGAGDDTYLWAAGRDAETIVEEPGAGNDTLEIRGSLTGADLVLLRSGEDLIVRLRGDAGQQVKVTGQFAGERIERLAFDDGTQWSAADISANLASQPTAGDDTCTGTTGNDQIDALAGNDHVNGLDGNDLINGGAGQDTLYGDWGDDTLLGDADNDRIEGQIGNDWLDGGAGNDTLSGDAGNDTLIAGGGGDHLFGDDGDDSLLDGLYMSGGAGSDRYQLTHWRPTTVYEHTGDRSAVDRLHLPIASSEVVVGLNKSASALVHDDLRLGTVAGQGPLIVEGFFEAPGHSSTIESFHFADGVTWSVADVYARLPINQIGDGDDPSIHGHSWSDVIDARGGNDHVRGNRGNDSISGASGDDQLYGNEGDDTLIGGSGADHLYGDSGYTTGQDGHDRLNGGAGADTLQGDGGNDSLDGGSGDDELLGGAGDDSYLIDAASGFDRINDTDGSDAIVLGAGIGLGNVGLFADGPDLVLTIGQTIAQTRIVNHHGSSSIERILFADGSEWNSFAIQARTQGGTANAVIGTGANDRYEVDSAGDTITEAPGQGIDSVTSSVSYALPAEVENLTLTGFLNLSGTGNALDNLIVGNAGNNHLDGLAGARHPARRRRR